MADLPSVQKIRDCLDVVEIVMGFLASGGQKADTRLDHYLMTALKMKDRFSSRKVRVRHEMREHPYPPHSGTGTLLSRSCFVTVGDTVCGTG